MTFKDLQKVIQSQSGPEQSHLLQRLRDKPFWLWERPEHKQADRATKGDCCFNHIVGLPTKDGVRKPLFDYMKTRDKWLAKSNGWIYSPLLFHIVPLVAITIRALLSLVERRIGSLVTHS